MTSELRSRLAADRETLISALLGHVDPGPVTGALPGAYRPADWLVSFADGRRLIYRPTSVVAQERFGRVLKWLNRRVPEGGPRCAAVLSRDGYGWVEFIESQPPAGRTGSGTAPAGPARRAGSDGAAEADRYYRRYGVLLAAAYAFDAAGITTLRRRLAEDCPVVVSVEAVLRPAPPELPDPGDPASVALATSVRRTGLLRPLSPLRPDGPVPEAAVLAGFRRGYDTIAAYRGDRARLTSAAHDLPGHALTAGAAAASTAGATGAASTADGASGTIDRLSDIDRDDQEWIISATLRSPAGRRFAARPRVWDDAPLSSIAAEPARLVAAACGLADQIVARGLADGQGPGPGRVNWLGLRPGTGGGWEVGPLGASLAHGYLGVALFLAQLADLSGIARYAEVAREALNGIPLRLAALGRQPQLVAATGCGGYEGLGGIGYALARIGTLLRDGQLADWAATAVRLAGRAAAADPAGRPGWAAGSAGCLAALLAVHRETGLPDADGLTTAIASRLAELVERTDGGCGLDDGRPGGFAAGPAGIGWALARFAAVRGEPAYLGPGNRATQRAMTGGAPGSAGLAGDAPGAEDAGDGWCRGTAGLLVARSSLHGPAELARLHADVLALSRRPVPRDLSLERGAFGIAEAIAVVAQATRAGTAAGTLRHWSGLLLDALRRRSDYCATPGGLSTPELLSGLSGIGYGLLRLCVPSQVPSVLLLEPAPAKPAGTTQPRIGAHWRDE